VSNLLVDSVTFAGTFTVTAFLTTPPDIFTLFDSRDADFTFSALCPVLLYRMSDKTGYDRELQDKTCGRLFKKYNKAVE
jgi:hypothetical protein